MTVLTRGTIFLVSIILIATTLGFLGRSTLQPALGAGNTHGDIDCDGDIDPVDATLVLQHSAGLFTLPDGCGKEEPTDTPTNTPVQPTDTSAPIPTSTPTPVPAVGLERTNPVPMGQSLIVPSGWEVTIVGFTPDATDAVLKENQFNDPPEPGMRFAFVRVRMTNVSAPDPEHHDAGFALRLVGSENVAYTTFTDWCGVIPDDIDFGPSEVFRNGTVEGNLCYQVDDTETGFAIFTDFFLADEEDRRWFAVN